MNQSHQIKIESGHLNISHHKSRGRLKGFTANAIQFVGLFVFFFTISSLVVMGPTIYSKISYYFFAPAIEENNI
ncbi:MAG: hypothetical protein V1807_02025, partial [Patescibacteria group bacterium]